MHPVAFFGGVTTGAVGLLAAALWDKKRTEAMFPQELEYAFSLDETGLCSLLNNFYFKAQDLIARCHLLNMKGGVLVDPPLELPDDDLLQKFCNTVAGKGNRFIRKRYEKNADDFKSQAQMLFSRYRNVFLAANEKLEKAGREPADLTSIHFSGYESSLDNSFSNEDWSLQFSEKLEKITDFLENACACANQLITSLEQKQA